MFPSRKNEKAKAATEAATACIRRMLQETPQYNAVSDTWVEQTWMMSNVIGHIQEGFGLRGADIGVQEIRIPIAEIPHADSVNTQQLNHALQQTATWQRIKDRNVMGYCVSRADNDAVVRPVRKIRRLLGFSVRMEKYTKTPMYEEAEKTPPQPCLVLRVPDAIHAGVSPDIKEWLQEIQAQLSVAQPEREMPGAGRMK